MFTHANRHGACIREVTEYSNKAVTMSNGFNRTVILKLMSINSTIVAVS